MTGETTRSEGEEVVDDGRKSNGRRREGAKLEKATFPARRVLSRIVTVSNPAGIWPIITCILEPVSYCLRLVLLFLVWYCDT